MIEPGERGALWMLFAALLSYTVDMDDPLWVRWSVGVPIFLLGIGGATLYIRSAIRRTREWFREGER